MNKQELLDFTEEIKNEYEAGHIHAPVHLSGTNEDQLIEIFKQVKPNDWIFSTWRSSYHWLLSGRDPEELRTQILNGRSMHVYGEKFFTSAIVGGIAPIALGVAWGLKLKGSEDKVWCFLGDGGAACGIAIESIKYAEGHDLPITYVIEDNGLCVNAVTKEVWGEQKKNKVIRYNYKRKHNHAGSGLNGQKKYIMF